MRVHFRGYFCDRVHGIAEIHRWQDKSVNGHDQFQIAFMMKLIDSFLVNILIIILGMIIILHEGPALKSLTVDGIPAIAMEKSSDHVSMGERTVIRQDMLPSGQSGCL